MKKILSLTLLAASIGFASFDTQAKNIKVTPANNLSAEVSAQTYRQPRYNRRVRVVNRTRIVRRGYRVYRETLQYRYLPNGRVQVRLLSRVRIR